MRKSDKHVPGAREAAEGRPRFRPKEFLIGAFFLIFGTSFLFSHLYSDKSAEARAYFVGRTIPCEVLSAQETLKVGNGIEREVAVTLRYETDGKRIEENQTLVPDKKRVATDEEIRELLERYQPGNTVVGKMSDHASGRLVLESKFPWKTVGFIAVTGIFILAGAGLILAQFGVLHPLKKRFSGERAGRSGGLILAVIFIGVGGYATQQLLRELCRPSGEHWESVPSVVEAAAVRRYSSGGSRPRTILKPEVLYRYEYGGRTLRSFSILPGRD